MVLEGTREEIEERALPFREGEEVLVHIEEPHMYNDDDAVAKLDGYVVSVIGAAPLVGQKTLVRIEKVARSAAQASAASIPHPAWRQTPPPSPPRTARTATAAAAPRRRGGRGRREKTEAGAGTGGDSRVRA